MAQLDGILDRVCIALGSNQGDRLMELQLAFAFLGALSVGGGVRRSHVFETAPVNCPPGSEPFLNAVAEIKVDSTILNPHQLLARLQDYERSRGRPDEREQNAPRPIDLDIIHYGDWIVNEGGLIIPHPLATQRLFVLEPLAQLRSNFILPGETLTVRELLEALRQFPPGDTQRL